MPADYYLFQDNNNEGLRMMYEIVQSNQYVEAVSLKGPEKLLL